MSYSATSVCRVSSTMTTSEVAAYWGVTLPTARKRLSRMGIRPTSRDPGREGENRYHRDAIQSHGGTGPADTQLTITTEE